MSTVVRARSEPELPRVPNYKDASAFECGLSSEVCAGVIAHEFAHTLGLDHVVDASDVMALGIDDETPIAFRDETFETVQPADCGDPVQNSYQTLLDTVGPWTGEERPVWVTTGAEVPRAASGCTTLSFPWAAAPRWLPGIALGALVVLWRRRWIRRKSLDVKARTSRATPATLLDPSRL